MEDELVGFLKDRGLSMSNSNNKLKIMKELFVYGSLPMTCSIKFSM